MNRSLLPLVLLLVVAGVAPSAADSPRVLTAKEWRDDLRALATELPRVHRDLYHALPPARLDSAVAALDRDIPRLSDHGIVLGLARVVALVHDGHTRLALPEDPSVAFDLAHSKTPAPKVDLVFHRLPLELFAYDDGLYVQAVTPTHRRALGARVVTIGGVPAAEALERVRPLIACDNEMGFRLWAPHRLVIPEVLAATGLARNPSHATFALRDTAGRDLVLELEPLPIPSDATTWIDVRDAPRERLTVSLRDPERPFALDWDAPHRLLYVRVSRIGDGPAETLAAFATRVARFVAAHPVEKLALDLRDNAGGNNLLGRSLVLALARLEKIDRLGRLFVIVGRGTFSAAMTLASQLEWWTDALFVGEPTGTTPSAYGDPKKIVLPHSGLVVRASTIYWRDWSTDEHRPHLAPDVPAPPTIADDRAHRDPALAAIVAFPASGYVPTLERVAKLGGPESAMLADFKRHTDPRTALEPTAVTFDSLGRLVTSPAAGGR